MSLLRHLRIIPLLIIGAIQLHADQGQENGTAERWTINGLLLAGLAKVYQDMRSDAKELRQLLNEIRNSLADIAHPEEKK